MDTLYYIMNPWWEGRAIEAGIDRKEYIALLPTFQKRKQIEILIGSRRAGKTTLLKQFIKELLQQGVPRKDIFYAALDHPSLSGTPISEHVKNMRRMFMHDRKKKLYLFFDEVQESPKWELELKSLYDIENLKIFCTGSTSSLIKSQGGRLTGRQIVATVYPLSFHEFILFHGEKPALSEDYKLERLAEDYLLIGGYPEHVLHPSSEYMANLLDDILMRDLIRLYPIKRAAVLKDLLRLIASSVGSRISFNKLSNVLGLAVDTVKDYLYYLDSAFIVSSMDKWTMSNTERIYAQKKIYFWDTGIKTLLTGTSDIGMKAENAVYMEMQRKKVSCGYFAESEREVDFVAGKQGSPLPIEVKYMSTIDLTDKRFSGIKLFLRRFPKTRKVLVISKNIEAHQTLDKAVIDVVPLWKFLLSSEQYLIFQ